MWNTTRVTPRHKLADLRSLRKGNIKLIGFDVIDGTFTNPRSYRPMKHFRQSPRLSWTLGAIN